jgi:hypothetical protein
MFDAFNLLARKTTIPSLEYQPPAVIAGCRGSYRAAGNDSIEQGACE